MQITEPKVKYRKKREKIKEKTKNKMLTLINYEYLKKVNSTHLNL